MLPDKLQDYLSNAGNAGGGGGFKFKVYFKIVNPKKCSHNLTLKILILKNSKSIIIFRTFSDTFVHLLIFYQIERLTSGLQALCDWAPCGGPTCLPGVPQATD